MTTSYTKYAAAQFSLANGDDPDALYKQAVAKATMDSIIAGLTPPQEETPLHKQAVAQATYASLLKGLNLDEEDLMKEAAASSVVAGAATRAPVTRAVLQDPYAFLGVAGGATLTGLAALGITNGFGAFTPNLSRNDIMDAAVATATGGALGGLGAYGESILMDEPGPSAGEVALAAALGSGVGLGAHAFFADDY